MNREDWYLRWAKASNPERVRIIWHNHRNLVIGVGLVTVGSGAWWYWGQVRTLAGWLDRYSETIRNLTLAFGVVAAIFGGWVAYRRSQTDRIRSETDRLRQVTESFEGAITLLGHEDRSVRLGAIYALERIARQNHDEHWPIMETLTAYVREWSKRAKQEASRTITREPEETAKQSPFDKLEPAPADLEAVFSVLGRRRLDHELPIGSFKPALNLTGAYLAKLVLRDPIRLELGHVVLRKANLSWAKLYGVILSWADLRGANLEGANLQGANLEHAQLKGTNLDGANLFMVEFYHANLEGADLSGANLHGADLSTASLKGADLSGADLRGADLSTANVTGADLSTTRGLTQEQLDSAFGDEETKIPPALTRPAQWSK